MSVNNKKKPETKEELEEKIAKLEKDLRFLKNNMANALSLYDQAKQEADNAKKEKSEFISKLSHEFRTPMNALMGYSDLLAKKDNDESVKGYVRGIKSATNRLLNMFNDLIEISRIESGTAVCNLAEYDTSVLINSLVDSISNEVAQKDLLMKVNVSEKLPTRLFGDFYHLRQIVCNLLDNAVKYTEKGYISLDISGTIGNDILENGRKPIQLVFKVKDTGIGIRKKDKDKLFGVFSQFNSKNPYANQGVGVGLTVAKYYSNKMHGDIAFESRFGEGALFTCTVMQEIIDESPVGADYTFDGNTRRQILFTAPSANVLIVDDSVVNLNVAKGLLEDYGIKADTAGGGIEAVARAGKKKYDLIFMDHMMPDMDGIEAMKVIRSENEWCENVPIIALTANATDEARQLFKSEGMEDFLAKPIEIELLRDILLKWLPKDKIIFGDISERYITKIDKLSDKAGTAFTKERLLKEGIDFELGLSYFGKNIEAYKSTMRDIVNDCSKKILLVEKYYRAKNLKNFAIEAHSIKSIAASVGATVFSDIAKECELRAKAGDIDYITKNGSYFIDKYTVFLNSVNKLLEEEKKYEEKSKAAEKNENSELKENQYSDEEIKKIIKESIEALEDFEADIAMSKLEMLLSQKNKVDLVEKLYQIKEKIDDFEYDEAIKLMRQLL